MKPSLVYFALLFTTLTVAAQSSGDWRPNIADDNKAATQADTMAFITQMLPKADVRNLSTKSEKACRLSFIDMASAKFQRPMRHHLELPDQPKLQLAVHQESARAMLVGWGKTHDWNLVIESRDIDFARIDPLEIVVKATQAGWSIRLAGTSGQAIGTRVSASYAGKLANDDDSLEASMRVVHDLNLSAPCIEKVPAGLSCTVGSGAVSDAEITLVDMETAHRLARAMMHEALTCGGTKAVSPF